MSTPSFDLAALEAIVARFAGRRIAVLGDCMVEPLLMGSGRAHLARGPRARGRSRAESSALGGAGNVAANLRALGAAPLLLGVVGEDDDGRRLREAFAACGLGVGGA